MGDELLKLKWNGHLSSFLHIFQSLRSKARYTDVTLACEGQLFTVHRLVLASCSQFFDHIFEQTPAENTVIILNEAKAHDIEALLDYMYCGQVDVHQSNLASFIRTAKCLQIKGLATPELPDDYDKVEEKWPVDSDGEISPKKKKLKLSTPPSAPATTTSAHSHTPAPAALPPTTRANPPRPHDNARVTPSPPYSVNSSLHSNRWVFQRSDLPNTTWSSSQANAEAANEARKMEGVRGDTRNSEGQGGPFPSGQEIWMTDSPTPTTSPRPQADMVKFSHQHYPLQLDNKIYNSNVDGHTDHFYRDVIDYKNVNIKTECEVKEEKESTVDDSENQIASEYNQKYHLNTYDREDSPEYFPSTVAFRGSNYENQAVIDAHNSFNQSRISYPLSLVKEVPPTTSQATVSPKFMQFAKCSNCLTTNTKLWRRSIKGEIVCNACGLYYKLHGVNRPSHLFRNAPMTRRRNPRKKKKLYEEIADSRDQDVLEDRNDSRHGSGCEDSDTQDGLAVLNAALTLNSLFAKAKAQEAAAAAAAGNSQADPRPHHSIPTTVTSADGKGTGLSLSSNLMQKGGDSPHNADTRPPPPPLLKLPQSPKSLSPCHLSPYPSFSAPHQKGTFVDDGRGRMNDEAPVSS